MPACTRIHAQAVVDLTVFDEAGETRTFCPVAALHSYTDVSPLVTAEWVRVDQREGVAEEERQDSGLPLGDAFLATTASFGPQGPRPSTAPVGGRIRRVAEGIKPSPFATYRDTRTSQQLYWKGMPSSDGMTLTGEDLARINDRTADLGR